MRRLRTLLPVLLCTFALVGCKDGKITLQSFSGDDRVTMKSEFADTPSERARGLMNRTSLDSRSGMLFVFSEPTSLNFWMKDTKIPLEVIYFDANGDFVNAFQMTPCEADPCPQYKSAALAQYALEVVPSFRQDNKIGVGWKLDLASVRKNSKPR